MNEIISKDSGVKRKEKSNTALFELIDTLHVRIGCNVEKTA
jgi:hypothetical protein